MAVEAWMLYRHLGTLLRWVMGMACPERVLWDGEKAPGRTQETEE